MLEDDPNIIPPSDDDALHNEDAPKVELDDAVLQRRDDQKFMAEMEHIVERAEQMRLKHMKTYRNLSFFHMIIMILSVLAGSAGFAWYILMHMNLQMGILCIVVGLAVPALLGLLKQGPIKAYRKHHKRDFMPEMARAMGGFRYFENRGIGEKVIKKSGVIPPYKTYHAEDCFMGRYQGVKVIMSEARLYSDKGKRNAVFDGIFILMEMPEEVFEGHTIITADQGLARSCANSRWQSLTHLKTPVTDPEWKRFLVYTNRVEAAEKQISENVFKELLETSQIFDDAPLSAVMFAKKFLFIAIPHEEDMFEACNIFVPVTLRSYLEKCRKEIDKMMEIIDLYELYAQKKA